jgi:hypothetical protein
MGEIYSGAERVIVWLGLSETKVKSVRWLHEEFFHALNTFAERQGLDALRNSNLIHLTFLREFGIQISLENFIQRWR